MRLAVLAAILASMALALGVAQESLYQPDPHWQAPADAATRVNPLAKNPRDVVGGGSKLFRKNCSECHGSDGQGGSRAPSLGLAVVQEQTDGTLFWKITNGNLGRGMPSWSRLPEAQRWQLVLFLRTLPRPGER